MASSSEDSVFIKRREGLGLQDMLEEFDAIVIPVRDEKWRNCCGAANKEISVIVGKNYNVVEETQPGQIKVCLSQALDGINRGIFGVPSAKKSEIEDLVKLLESQNPNPNPTANLDKHLQSGLARDNSSRSTFSENQENMMLIQSRCLTVSDINPPKELSGTALPH